MSIVARTKISNAAAITSAVRSELAAVDRNIPLVRVRVFEEYLSRALARPRFNAMLLSIFAGTALLLTAIGIYGVLAYSVSQRTSEIGIRIALGAGKSSIFRLVVGQAMTIGGNQSGSRTGWRLCGNAFLEQPALRCWRVGSR